MKLRALLAFFMLLGVRIVTAQALTTPTAYVPTPPAEVARIAGATPEYMSIAALIAIILSAAGTFAFVVWAMLRRKGKQF